MRDSSQNSSGRPAASRAAHVVFINVRLMRSSLDFSCGCEGVPDLMQVTILGYKFHSSKAENSLPLSVLMV